MATKKTTNLTAPTSEPDLRERAERMKVAREEADALAALRASEANEALALQEDLSQRVASGDASVQPLELVTAEANVLRTAGLAKSAAEKAADAKIAEAPVLAQWVAKRASLEPQSDAITEAKRTAERAIIAALRAFAESVGDHNRGAWAVIKEMERAGANAEYMSMHRSEEPGYEQPLAAHVLLGGGAVEVEGEPGHMIQPVSLAGGMFGVLQRSVTAADMRFTPLTTRIGLEVHHSTVVDEDERQQVSQGADQSAKEARDDRAFFEDKANAARRASRAEATSR